MRKRVFATKHRKRYRINNRWRKLLAQAGYAFVKLKN